MANRLGRLTAGEALANEEAETIATATGLSVTSVRNRLWLARGNTLVRNVFSKEWPWQVDRLGPLTVAFGRDQGLHEELAKACGLTERGVSRRLNKTRGNMLLSNAFPEMTAETNLTVGEEEEEEEEAEKNRDDEEEEEEEEEKVSKPTQSATTLPRSRPLRRASSPIVFAKRWQVLRELGKGGFGAAYEVRDLRSPHHQLVVLKVANEKDLIERLRQEATLAFGLHHSNICAYRHIDEDPQLGTFVLMHHGGTSLDVLIKKRPRLKLDVALDIVRQAAAGIDYAHEHDVLHLDIKPGNILIRERDANRREVRISDFGISQQGREAQTVGGGRTVIGTKNFGHSPGFASPEQFSGQKVSRKSDQYSLALVFCAMLEAEVFGHPYHRRSFNRLSDGQNQALERALSLEPTKRFRKCSLFVEALSDG